LVVVVGVKFYSKPKPCGKVIAELKPLNRIGKESK